MSLETLIASRDAEGVMAALEKAEMDAAVDGSGFKQYQLQLASYLLVGDLDRARLMYHRVPTNEKERNVELKHIWGVATHMLAADRRSAFAKLTQFQWSNAMTPLIVWLVESYRDRNAALLARAYSNVSLRVAAPALGLEPNDAAAFLAAHGWTREDDVFVAPVAAADPALQAAIAQKQKITADEVTRLAEQVLFVEQ